MAKKITPEQLQAEILGILKDYNNNVTEGTKEAVKKVVKNGVKEVKAAAQSNFKATRGGDYVSGWTSTIETGRISAQGVIHNSKVPGLPHLLEKGHQKRNGEWWEGKEHIKPVEEECNRQIEEAIRQVIQEA